MEHRRLGNSDIEVSVVTLGAWAIGGWMWGGQDYTEAISAIRTSIECGVDCIDTAAVYGFGASEKLVAEALGPNREKVKIFTKFGLRWDVKDGEFHLKTTDNDGNPLEVYRNARPESVIHECENSLRRLNTDYIDLYQIHWPDPLTPVEETFGAIEKLIKAGKIRAAGVSNYKPELMAQATQVVPLASAQPPYSMLQRDIEADVLPWCRENNVGVIVYSPMQRGLLTGKVTPERQFNADDHRAKNPMFSSENRRRVIAFLESIRHIADLHNASFAQLAVNWVISQPGISAALVGARNTRQAKENAAAASFRLSGQELDEIQVKLNEFKLEN